VITIAKRKLLRRVGRTTDVGPFKANGASGVQLEGWNVGNALGRDLWIERRWHSRTKGLGVIGLKAKENNDVYGNRKKRNVCLKEGNFRFLKADFKSATKNRPGKGVKGLLLDTCSSQW